MIMKNDKKLKVAMIGLGKIAWAYEKDPLVSASDDFPTHFRVLSKHPNFHLAAAQDKNAQARKEFSSHAKKSGLDPKMYENWEALIASERPDLLVVASNTDSHYEICDRAIDSGVKNILCEKPISYSLKEAVKLVKKAEKNNCELYVNYTRAFNPSYSELVEKIRNGFLGKIQSFDVKYVRGIINNGTHALDLLIRMLGEVKSAEAVKAAGQKMTFPDTTVSAAVQFKNGTGGYLHGLSSEFYGIFELEILGELGRIIITGDKSRIYMRQDGKRGVLREVHGGENLINTKIGHYPIYDAIYSCIASGDNRKNKCSGRDALRSLKVADMIVKSSK